MFKRLQGFISGVVVATILFSAVTAFAANTKTLQAVFSGIKIYVDGVKITPKDPKGNVVEPFVVDGTTYLPVREVAEALGKDVNWDGSTQSVYIGAYTKQETSNTAGEKPKIEVTLGTVTIY